MQVSQMFEAKDVYFGALLGGIVGYFGFVALVGLSVVVGSGQIGELLNVLIMGLVFGTLPAAVGSALIVAPIAALVALAALGWLPNNRWHGAITGVLTALVIIAGLMLFAGGEWREAPDMGTFAFLAGAMLIAAFAGWITQRRFLRLIDEN